MAQFTAALITALGEWDMLTSGNQGEKGCACDALDHAGGGLPLSQSSLVDFFVGGDRSHSFLQGASW